VFVGGREGYFSYGEVHHMVMSNGLIVAVIGLCRSLCVVGVCVVCLVGGTASSSNFLVVAVIGSSRCFVCCLFGWRYRQGREEYILQQTNHKQVQRTNHKQVQRREEYIEWAYCCSFKRERERECVSVCVCACVCECVGMWVCVCGGGGG